MEGHEGVGMDEKGRESKGETGQGLDLDICPGAGRS